MEELWLLQLVVISKENEVEDAKTDRACHHNVEERHVCILHNYFPGFW